MLERIPRSGRHDALFFQRIERSPRRRQQDLPYLRLPPPLQTLEDGGMLRIYGYYAVTVGEIHDPRSAGDERFLVGEGDLVSGPQCPDCGREAGEAYYAVQDDVCRCFRQGFGRARTGEEFGVEAVEWVRGRCPERHVFGVEFFGLFGQRIRVASCTEADYFEAVGVLAYYVEGLAADAAGRAQDREASSHGGVGAVLIRVGRCSIPRGR